MKILVIGAGVLGCNIAANLYKAGKDVTLLARGAWYETVREKGLRIKRKFIPGIQTVHIPVVDELRPEDAYDVIVVSLRYTQLPTIYDALKRCSCPTIIFNGNNTRAEETAAQFPDKHIFFSFTLSAGHREQDHVVSIDLKQVTMGGLKGGTDGRKLAEDVFGSSRYKVTYEPNMGDYLLSHAAFVVPIAFACYDTDGELKKMKGNKAYFDRIILANQEAYAALEATGHEILPASDQEFRTEKWARFVRRFYGLMAATSLGKLCASDHALNAVDEMQALAEDIGDIIRASGLPSTEYHALWKAIDKYL